MCNQESTNYLESVNKVHVYEFHLKCNIPE